MPESSRQGKRKAGSSPRSLPLRRSQRIREKMEVEPDSYFCELCRAALDGRLPALHEEVSDDGTTIVYEHHRDLDGWKNAANDACYFCALFLRRIQDFHDNSRLFTFDTDFPGISVSIFWRVFNVIEEKAQPEHRNIEVEFRLGKDCDLEPDLNFYLEPTEDHERAQSNRVLTNAGTAKSTAAIASFLICGS